MSAISSSCRSPRSRDSTFRSRCAARALAAALAGLAGGCTFTRTEVTDCQSDSACRNAFGLGFVCGADGLCDEVEPPLRCTQTYPAKMFEHRFENRNRIIFGNLMDRSVTTHVAREQSAELAYFQANDQGGLALNGAEPREFGAVFCTIQDDQESQEFDGKSRPEAAVQAAGFLVRTLGLPAILGPAASSDTKAVFEDLADTGALVISPSATSPELTGLDPETVSDDAPGLLWRTAPSDALQGAVIAADMRGPGMGRVDPDPVSEVVVIHETGAYGEGLFDVFAGEFVARGGSPPQELVYAGTSQTELTDAISDAGLTSAQEVLFISSQAPQIVTFLETADQLAGYAEKNIFLTDAAANPDVLAADTSLFARVRATRLAPLDADNPVYSSFIVAYDARYRADVQDFSYAANAYDAAWLLVYGAAWAQFQAQGGISGQHIARGLRHVSVGEKVELRASTWTSVQQAFKAGDSIDVAGASGELDYDPATEETSADVEVWKPANGTIEGIYKVSP